MLPEIGARGRIRPHSAGIRGRVFDRPDFRLFPVLLAIVAALGCGGCGRSAQSEEEAFIADRSVTLWSSTAQVREPVASLHYGDRVEVLERQNDQARVLTTAGAQGWTEQRNLMDSALWNRARALAQNALSIPVQASATTDKLTNVHIEPGRTAPRTYQLRSGTALDVLAHATAGYVRGGPEEGAGPEASAADAAETRHEDWALVRAREQPVGEVAGWVLRRFVKYEIPAELLDYSAQYRFVAWFDLGHVPSGQPAVEAAKTAGRVEQKVPGAPESAPAEPAAPGEKPQFLVAGIQGPEGQACDFSLIRVYTWGAQRQRYETAYVESKLCGTLPIHVQPAASPGAIAAFSFANRGRAGEEHREYVMRQTSVRRTDNRPAGRRKH